VPQHLTRARHTRPKPFLVDDVGFFEYLKFQCTTARTERWIRDYVQQGNARDTIRRPTTDLAARERGVFWPGLTARMETWLGVSSVALAQLALLAALPFITDW
jgi:hypothetical protein